ncbi:uncharacterized protein H6S33_003757 [Morchella sextelata]|uniref:uncharacterized protein n=1 Tax=Morchella sextelata TaxID=1174677 RepID=UPI001D03F78E|nr:uncharacterized protein H6S33_003757 [Morchella sextelata]KAH0606096.1 hypothetical protein H6S33_003757 [Morchella sextelata]
MPGSLSPSLGSRVRSIIGRITGSNEEDSTDPADVDRIVAQLCILEATNNQLRTRYIELGDTHLNSTHAGSDELLARAQDCKAQLKRLLKSSGIDMILRVEVNSALEKLKDMERVYAQARRWACVQV